MTNEKYETYLAWHQVFGQMSTEFLIDQNIDHLCQHFSLLVPKEKYTVKIQTQSTQR